LRLAHLAFIAITACGGDSPQGPLDPAATNILFVGNSLTSTNDLPGMVAALIDSAGLGPAMVRSRAYPDFGLEDHWNQGGVQKQLAEAGWDYVVMQQGPSATEGRPSLLEYAERFAIPIRTAGAEPALYMVWPAATRSFDWDGVRDSYQMAAAQAGGLFLPAGEAWREAWQRDPSLALYGADGFHPSPLGTYLAALVIAERVTGRSAVGMAREIATRQGVRLTVPAAVAQLLQESAHAVSLRYPR
jgi:hypothetical protein